MDSCKEKKENQHFLYIEFISGSIRFLEHFELYPGTYLVKYH